MFTSQGNPDSLLRTVVVHFNRRNTISNSTAVSAVPAVPAVSTLETVGDRYSVKARKDLVEIIRNDMQRTDKDSDHMSEMSTRISPIDLMGPDTKPQSMFGYLPDDIIHTAPTWRAVQAGAMTSILDGAGTDSSIFTENAAILLHVVNHYEKTTGKAPYNDLMNDKGELVPLIDVIAPEWVDVLADGTEQPTLSSFKTLWGNGELGYHGLKDQWIKLQNNAATNIARIRKSLAMHTEVVEGVEDRMIGGKIYRIDCKVKQIKNPIVREFVANKKAVADAARLKAALAKAEKLEQDTISEMVTAVMELMGKVETPTVTQMDVPSRDAVNKHLSAALASLKKAKNPKPTK